MAAKGYVVLFTNPRGSTSLRPGLRQHHSVPLPGDDYKDLMAGVDEVLKRGYVDREPLGVTGGSGGGLLTNWTITQTQRFKAACRAARHRRLVRFCSPPTSRSSRRLVQEGAVGRSRRLPPALADHHVADVTTPLMLILGDADYRTPPGEAGSRCSAR
jgi:dipeptidyl aminopeptidase/acylaminoacyl peptidase